jgi:hypothetical protein
MSVGLINTFGYGPRRLINTFGYGGPSLAPIVIWTESACQGAPGGWHEGAGASPVWSEGQGAATGWTEAPAPPLTSWDEDPPGGESFWERTGK